MGEHSKSMSFAKLVQKSDPLCFHFNFAKQGEFDLGLPHSWRAYLEGERFECAKTHLEAVEAEIMMGVVLNWQPDTSWAVEDQIANFSATVARMLVRRELPWCQKDQIIDYVVHMQLAHNIRPNAVLEQMKLRPN